jgi:predicted  nucleic acid-binding Zn-ribbon protein
MDWKAKFQDVLTDLERERDELKVRMHLAKAEARDEMARLEGKLDELRFRAGAARTEARSAMEEIGEAAGTLAEEIKQGFDRVRKTL